MSVRPEQKANLYCSELERKALPCTQSKEFLNMILSLYRSRNVPISNCTN